MSSVEDWYTRPGLNGDFVDDHLLTGYQLDVSEGCTRRRKATGNMVFNDDGEGEADLAAVWPTCYNQPMIQVRNDLLETNLEATFSPAPYDAAILKSVATEALNHFGKYELKPNQVYQRAGDQLFDYTLAFTLFNNQATFRLSSDRLLVRVQGAKNEKDAQILAETLVLSAQCIKFTVIRFNVQAMAHAAFDVEGEGTKYFESFVDKSNHIIEGGRIVVVKQPDWATPVRLTVEKSLGLKNGVFLSWSTDHDGPVSLENIKIIADKFGKAVNSLGLAYRIE